MNLSALIAAVPAADGLRWSPALALPLVIALAGLALGLAVLVARRVKARSTTHPLAVLGPTLFRAIVIACLAAILLGPSVFDKAADQTARPIVTLLVDRSWSMTVPDEHEGGRAVSRAQAVSNTWLSAATIARLSEAADVRLVAFDARAESTSLDALLSGTPEGDTTRLAQAVTATLSTIGADATHAAAPGSPAASRELVLLSDGIDTDGAPLGALGAQAVAAGVRIHTVCVGSDAAQRDVSLLAAPQSPVVYDGQPTSIRVSVRHTGFDGQPARLTIREGGPEGEIVHSSTIVLGPGASEVDAQVHPRRAEGTAEPVTLVEYDVRIEPLAGEADESNNARRAFVQVTAERIRVLVFEGEPYWDTRFFIEALRQDPQIELTSVQGLGDSMTGSGGPRVAVVRYVPGASSFEKHEGIPMPQTEEELRAYDVIVLGRGIEAFFPGDAAGKLVRFVTQRGGSLVFLRGPAITARTRDANTARESLETIAPVAWGREVLSSGQLVRTDEGSLEPSLDFDRLGSTDAVLSELPGMLAATRIEREKALSVVWLRQGDGRAAASADSAPAALACMNVGAGRTLAVLTDGMWRWAFLPTDMREYESVYQLFWSRTVRWLALGSDFLPGQSIGLTTDRVYASPGEAVQVTVRTRFIEQQNFSPALKVIEPDGTERTLTLSAPSPTGTSSTTAARNAAASGAERFNASFIPEQQGVHTVVLEAPGMAPDRLTTRFAVYDDRVERLDTAARRDDMRRLAESTGGRALSLTEADMLRRQLIDDLAAQRTSRAAVPAWDRWWVFALLLSALAADWIWRRRIGLP